ncbi:hypothetical protein LV780_03900 [Cereibacter azotoformans]|uniref:Uncharacterized protein n=1 Tax=Cereibacter azotoformans TaxID=43057 RepID=A0A2T5JWU1_9RHOB|nr:hypothetical protein [Cereibacter azotoformans]PTR14620.1 hypothetical protein C8J28_11692 [Cereibacter azotoformans]UIJ31332.1 hypothetical protein LV780_03900 [Cereibacter azotoformans]
MIARAFVSRLRRLFLGRAAGAAQDLVLGAPGPTRSARSAAKLARKAAQKTRRAGR